MNNITFIGNLGADPVLRTTGNNTPVCNMRVAVNEGETVTWHNVTAWEDLAISMAKAKKGAQVVVTGKLEVSTWDREVTAPKSGEVFTIKTDSYSIKAQEIFITSEMNSEIISSAPTDTVPLEVSNTN